MLLVPTRPRRPFRRAHRVRAAGGRAAMPSRVTPSVPSEASVVEIVALSQPGHWQTGPLPVELAYRPISADLGQPAGFSEASPRFGQ
jgi:hypothetical protein